MLIPLSDLITKYNIQFKGILHVGAHECEEITDYEQHISRDKILWIEAIPEKVEFSKQWHSNILIEQAVVSDTVEDVTFHISNNGQSSSILELGTHKIHHPGIHYVHSFSAQTKMLKDILCNYSIDFNFLNLDIQGAELKALKGMEHYLSKVEYIYTEVNDNYVYENCALINDIDEYLKGFGFVRVETAWFGDCHWGDAFYIKE